MAGDRRFNATDAARELVLDAVVESRKDVGKIGPRIAELAAKQGWDGDEIAAVQAATEYMLPDWLAMLEAL